VSQLTLPSEPFVNAHPAQPDAIPWGWWDIARVVGLLLVSLLSMFFALVVQVIFRGRATDPVIESETINLAFYISWLLAIYWCSVRRYGITWAALGLRRVAWWWVIAIPVCLVGMQIMIGAVQAGIDAIRGQPLVNPQIQMMTHGQTLIPIHLVLLLLSSTVGAPIVEELFYRGMLYPLMRRATGPWIAVVLNASVFALAHGIPVLFPMLFVMGVVFALVRERTNSLLPGIGIHALQNTLFVVNIYMGSQANAL
jgi:uncharacterized protein